VQTQFLSSLTDTILGQILLDTSYSLPTLLKIYNTHFSPFFAKYCIGPEAHPTHPNAVIYQYIFAWGCREWGIEKLGKVGEVFTTEGKCVYMPYRVKDADDGPGWIVRIHGKVLFRGEAENQSIATRRATEGALKRLKGDGLAAWCGCEGRKKGKAGDAFGMNAI
jgi:hypothetical protein